MNPHDGEPGATPRLRVATRGMAYGPYAIAERDGKILLVRGAAPGEEVEVVVVDERRSFAYAQTVAVRRPSPARRQPPCPYLPRCGGCPWQHLEYAAQLAAKEAIVREQLRRIGGIDAAVAPILPSPGEYGYRRRLKLRVQDGAVGFNAAASHTLVAVEHCLLAEPPIDAAIAGATELVQRLRTRLRRIELVAHDASETGVVAVGQAQGPWAPDDEATCRGWLARHSALRGLVLCGRRWRHVWGDDRLTVRPEDDLAIAIRAGTFSQVNRAANRLLVATALEFAEPRPGQRVLDCYAGAGNFSLPLARRGASVVAIEQHAQAAADGAANARRLNLLGCRFLRAPVEQAIDGLIAAGDRFDLAVLDPPRSGARAALAPLMRLAPARIVYVSCDPATLARDLRELIPRYRIEMVQPIDLFPHTYHVETVVRAAAAC